MNPVFDYIDAHLGEALEATIDYCRLPSVSAQQRAIDETARYTVDLLEREGFEARIVDKPAGGLPAVLAEQRGSGPGTLLFYNHYDVQPPDPLDEWTSGPFEPQWRGDRLYGRGASDNKGNITSRLLAVRALKEAGGGLPCTVRFCIEGDEEIGSPQVKGFIEEHAESLRADACIWEGGYAFWDGGPTLMLGVKGLLYVELEARGPARDVHSSYATIVPNPAWRLAWALGSLKSPEERILIDGFYDGVQSPGEDALASIRILPDESTRMLSDLGVGSAVLRLQGVEYNRRHILEPTCTIDGLTSGYQGPGAKTILPASARAKLDFRLVADQDPEDILRKLRSHLDRQGFDDIAIHQFSTERAARTPMDDPFVALCAEGAREAYGRDAFLIPNFPATGPMYHFAHDLGLPCVMAGVNYIGGRDHAPDEHIRIEDFRAGTKHIASILRRFAVAE